MRLSGVASTRNLLGPALRGGFRLQVTGAHLVPARGPVLLVANHDGLADATFLALGGPRPVRVVTDAGTVPGLWGRLSGATGRILVRQDPAAALRAAAAALRAGAAVGMFPEGSLPPRHSSGRLRPTGPGAAYVQVTSGAAVVPVAMFGTAGQRPTDPPAPRSRIDIFFGEPWLPPPPKDPRSRAAVLEVAEAIRQRLSDHVDVSRARAARLDPREDA